MTCPLCTISKREELIYKDNDIFLVSTKDLKGHYIRVMVCIYEHREKPTFAELSKAYAVIINYMNQVMDKKEWLLVDGKFASHPNHWHLIASDPFGTPEELEALRRTPTVKLSGARLI